MLGDLDLGPGAQPRRRHQRQHGRGRTEHDRGLRHPRIGPAIAGGDTGRERGDAGIQDQRHCRQRAHRDRSRQGQRPVAAAVHADDEQDGHAGHRRTAPDDRGRDPARLEIDRARDDQVDAPHRRQGEHDQPQAAARRGCGLVDMVDQHQRADRPHHPEYGARRSHRRERLAVQADPLDDRQQRRGAGQRHHHEIHCADRGVAGPVAADQREHENQPRDIPRAGGDPGDHIGRIDPGNTERPQARRPERDQECRMWPMPAGAPDLRKGQCTEQQGRKCMAPQDQCRNHGRSVPGIIARRPATAPREESAIGSAGRETVSSSWRNTGRIRACDGNPRSTRHRDS